MGLAIALVLEGTAAKARKLTDHIKIVIVCAMIYSLFYQSVGDFGLNVLNNDRSILTIRDWDHITHLVADANI